MVGSSMLAAHGWLGCAPGLEESTTAGQLHDPDILPPSQSLSSLLLAFHCCPVFFVFVFHPD